MSEIAIFKDLGLEFGLNPLTKDVSKKINLNAIKQSIYNLLMMKQFDEKFHPEINGGVQYYLFENFTPLIKISLENMIKTVLGNYEPRISVSKVEVENRSDPNAIEINIYYTVVSTGLETSYKFYAYRQR